MLEVDGSSLLGARLQEVLRHLFRSGADRLVHRNVQGVLILHKDELISSMERDGALCLQDLLARLEDRRGELLPDTGSPERLLLLEGETLSLLTAEEMRQPHKTASDLPEWWSVPLPLIRLRKDRAERNDTAEAHFPDGESLAREVRGALSSQDLLCHLPARGGEERTLALHPLTEDVVLLEDITADCTAAEELAWWAAVGHSLVERLRQNGIRTGRFSPEDDLPQDGEVISCLWEGDLLGYLHIPCPEPEKPAEAAPGGTKRKTARRRPAASQ